MKIFNIFKKVTIPTGETEEITAYESWYVRWTSRFNAYSGDIQSECEIFPTEIDAINLLHN